MKVARDRATGERMMCQKRVIPDDVVDEKTGKVLDPVRFREIMNAPGEVGPVCGETEEECRAVLVKMFGREFGMSERFAIEDDKAGQA